MLALAGFYLAVVLGGGYLAEFSAGAAAAAVAWFWPRRQLCAVLTPRREPVISREHNRAGLFTGAQAARLAMPERYRAAIAAWLRRAEPGGQLSGQNS
jgi:hypothetical protein